MYSEKNVKIICDVFGDGYEDHQKERSYDPMNSLKVEAALDLIKQLTEQRDELLEALKEANDSLWNYGCNKAARLAEKTIEKYTSK